MNARDRSIAAAMIALFFAIQIGHTLFNSNTWPFCSYNMFFFLVPVRKDFLKVVLHDARGATQTVDPGNVLPIEFFRAYAIIDDVYKRHHDRVRQDRLARAILARLNSQPWRGLDETWASPRSAARFVSLDVVLQSTDLSGGAAGRPPLVTNVRPLYSFTAAAP